jgi:uncharacterized repeat protein (TIGR03803 family)
MTKPIWEKSGCALMVMCAATAITLPAQTLKTIVNFDNIDGANDRSAVVQATDGNLYGTTESGGDRSYGTFFKISPGGTLTSLYSFCSDATCTDGQFPSGVIQATDGNFYGTTGTGGAYDCFSTYIGCGTVFKISSTGTLTTLHDFDGSDGYSPGAGLIQATDGNFYGTASGGGANMCSGGLGCGTLFKITPSGRLTVLYNFCSQSNCADGWAPDAALVQASDGSLYGTTHSGGTNGLGTIFRIAQGGRFTTLHSFNGGDGATPVAALIEGADGNLYGTTYYGGYGVGTVFKTTRTGKLTTLYSFSNLDGQYPSAALVQVANGKLYGTTVIGGTSGYGTVFRITPDGTLTTLLSFDGTNGNSPYGSLILAPNVNGGNGTFYGTTAYGGPNTACPDGCGVVFSLTVDLEPAGGTQGTARNVPSCVGVTTKLTEAAPGLSAPHLSRK